MPEPEDDDSSPSDTGPEDADCRAFPADSGDPEDLDDEADDPGDSGDGAVDSGHLEDVPDGCGCVELWEHLAEHRGDGE